MKVLNTNGQQVPIDDLVGAKMEATIKRYLRKYDSSRPPSIENSPDTAEEMFLIGRFNMRFLAMELGIFTRDEDKENFMQMSNSEQAEALIAAKRRWERDHGQI